MDFQTCPGKKKFVCDISGKKLFVFDQGEKNVMFSCWKEKNNLVKKKNHTLPPGIKWSAPKVTSWNCLLSRTEEVFDGHI